jgi:thiamine kinase-like enzyme
MADIYKLNIKCENIYDFKFYAEKIMGEMQINKYDTKSEILRNFLEHNREVFIRYWNIYVNLVNKVRDKNSKFYLTHGDVAKNLMINENNQVFIIDWDRIRLGPIELDLNEFVDKSTNIKKLENTAKSAGLDWEFDKDYHNYFVINRLYYDLRNQLNIDNDKITADSLIGFQQYINNLCTKYLM